MTVTVFQSLIIRFTSTILYLSVFILLFSPQLAYCSDSISAASLSNILNGTAALLNSDHSKLILVFFTICRALRIFLKDGKIIIRQISEWITYCPKHGNSDSKTKKSKRNKKKGKEKTGVTGSGWPIKLRKRLYYPIFIFLLVLYLFANVIRLPGKKKIK